MATEKKQPKGDPAPKKETAAKTESTPGKDTAKDTAKDVAKDTAKDVAKAESTETPAATPSNYSRGEGQKPVTKAYKENWNAIFGKKKKKR